MDMRASLRFIIRVWSLWMRAEAHAVMGRLMFCGVVWCVWFMSDRGAYLLSQHRPLYITPIEPTPHLTIMKARPASAEGPRTWKIK